MTLAGAIPRWPRRLRAGLGLLAALSALAVVGPWMAGDPTAIVDPKVVGLLPPGSVRAVVVRRDGTTVAGDALRRSGPDWVLVRGGAEVTVTGSEVARAGVRRFWAGTDVVGRDVLARLVNGARVSLGVGALALAVALVLGVGVGLLAGWRGGIVDALLMRLVDALLAIPMLFLLLFLAALFRPSLAVLVLFLGFSSWMGVARLVRGQVLSLKERDFILAARAIGAGPWRIAFRHLLPNALTPLAQDAALRLGDLILVEASLSFLGLGVQPPAASWGTMVAEGQEVLANAWWLTGLPTALVAATVIAAALAADGLQELARSET
ncbi:MAG TPA: ABC transporter permease [Thermoanaerobaculaceae bacterium]|nr:ABC transporter permease [Thermoanaerobaculaceae bacterium]